MAELLVTCEHASGEVPPGLELGLSPRTLASHVSCDRGARRIATTLSGLLDAPIHLGRWSRLVVDLNRMEENPEVILAESYGVHVPGNQRLSATQRAARLEAHHRPYRHAARADAHALAARRGCLHISVHSFDPQVEPAARTYDAGVLFDTAREPEASVAGRLADGLRSGGLDVRLNEPYAGVPEGLTSWLRAQIPADRYLGIEVEASQGWMSDGDDGPLDDFAVRLSDALRPILLTGW